jgi:hypothetical protein
MKAPLDSHEVYEHNLDPRKGPNLGVKFSNVPVPANLREAQQTELWEYWKAAMHEEDS